MHTEARVTRSRARCTGEELVKGVQSERKAARPASLTLSGSSAGLPRPVLVERLDTSNTGIKAADMALTTKKAPASASPQKDACKVLESDRADDSKTDAAEVFMPATPTQLGPAAEDNPDGAAAVVAAAQQQLLQEAAKLTLDEQPGITPARLPQPTPANTPVYAPTGAMGKPASGPSNGSRLSEGMRLEEEMMLTPLDAEARRELAQKSFMAAAAEAIAQAAAYPGLQAERAAQPQKLAAMLASVVVGGDEAAANRAPAPQEAMAGGAEEEVAVKEAETFPAAPCEKKPAGGDASVQADKRTTAEIQRDLKAAIRMKHAAKKAPGSAPVESSTYPGISPADAAGIQDDASSALCSAMGDLGIDPEVRKPLRGQPLPRGRHTRFSESGGATDSPTGERVLLRGVAAPSGAHLRFEGTPDK